MKLEIFIKNSQLEAIAEQVASINSVKQSDEPHWYSGSTLPVDVGNGARLRNVMVRPARFGKDDAVNVMLPCWYKQTVSKWRLCGGRVGVHLDDVYSGPYEWRELLPGEEVFTD